MSFCLQGCPKIHMYWSLQDEKQINLFNFHAWGTGCSSRAGQTAVRRGKGKGEKVVLLRCCPWAQARQSSGFSPARPISPVSSAVTTRGRKGLCSGVMSGGKAVLLDQSNTVSAAWS